MIVPVVARREPILGIPTVVSGDISQMFEQSVDTDSLSGLHPDSLIEFEGGMQGECQQAKHDQNVVEGTWQSPELDLVRAGPRRLQLPSKVAACSCIYNTSAGNQYSAPAISGGAAQMSLNFAACPVMCGRLFLF